jgi:hypothetical protein
MQKENYMTEAFQGIVNLDIRDSKPDWEPYLQTKAPGLGDD